MNSFYRTVAIGTLLVAPIVSMGVAYTQLHGEASASDYATLNANWETAGDTRFAIRDAILPNRVLTSQQAMDLISEVLMNHGLRRASPEAQADSKESQREILVERATSLVATAP